MLDHNVTYPIAPALVAAQIDAAIARLEGSREGRRRQACEVRTRYDAIQSGAVRGAWPRDARPPCTPDEVDAVIDGQIARQRDHYASVRVVKPARTDGYVLVYGDADDATVDSGTGPFDSLGQAVAWFTGGGR